MLVLSDVFKYCATTGVISRRIRTGNFQAGTVCNSLTTCKGYYKVKFAGVHYLQHRLAWFLYYGVWPDGQVDHIDGNGLNNSIVNLREADNSTNQFNINVTRKSQTGIKGVFPIRGGTLYRAEVCVRGKRHQKHSVDPAKLEVWVRDMREQLHGEFVKH